MKAFLATVASVLLAQAFADTPNHCLYNQTQGVWQFSLSANNGNNNIVCPQNQLDVQVVTTFTVNLTEPDIAVRGDGTQGFWTMMYDEGFEVQLANQKFYAFQNWTTDSQGNVISNCGLTNVGFFHDFAVAPGVIPANWGCYYATKIGDSPRTIVPRKALRSQLDEISDDAVMVEDPEFAARINAEQSLWTASPRSVFTGMRVKDAFKRMGKRTYQSPTQVKPNIRRKAVSAQTLADLPAAWDWRNVSGSNYVCPVRNQGDCGSCYSFGSTGALCARTSIATGAVDNFFWSPQTVVSCSPYSQGCDGGFAYLVFKYGEDFGIPRDSCFPYASQSGVAPPCSGRCNDTTQFNYATDYYFVGGYYGAATPENMMQEIMTNGPVSVEFMVYPDFQSYTGGVYVHTQAATEGSGLNPWQATNHEVQMVGWGITSDNVPYWICQNSWGSSWGESGYFRILRGSDECAIESIPAAASPVYSSSP